MKRTLLFIAVLICLGSTTWAVDFISPKHLGADARSIGLGQVFGFSKNASSVFKNPAYLNQSSADISLSLFKTEIIEAEYFNTAMSYKTWGLGYMTVVEDFWKTSFNDAISEIEKEKKAEYSSSIYYAVYGFEYEAIPIGIALKYYHSVLDNLTGDAFNADVGFYLEDFMQIGELSCVLKDILQTKYTYSNDGKETMPTEMISSLKIPFQTQWFFYPQLRLTKGAKFKSALGCGVEYQLIKFCSLYGGYREYYVDDTKKGQLSGGVALGNDLFQVDYALQAAAYHDQNLYHYLSLSINL